MPNLIAERGREKGQSFELASGASVVVGRDPQTAQIVIADVAASRRHFQLTNRNGKWFVADLGSKNGTFLNEEKLEKETELSPGDRVQVGESVFTFNDDLKADDKSAGLAGKEIGGYRILERIGRGGMGTVFKAKQVSLNRLVALKFLSPKLSKDPAFVAKFFAEARAAAQLNHPNVVQVFDVGTLGGVSYFSMEFMEGGCVQDLLTAREDSRLPWQDAMPVIIDSVRGLVFAEKRGIIHRDIKPDNLMLTSEQKVKIGDLGLATSAEGGTEKGIFGTPHFIAPEQAQGRDVTHAADLYSLGATIYRMVCGKTPFQGSTVKEILRAQINDPHVPIPQIVPDFPPELAAIVDKLMAKKVEDRYQSATKLLEDLEAFQLAHHIELAGGVKSRKPFYIALGVLGVALAGVVVWAVTRPPKIQKGDTVTRTVEVFRGTTGPTMTEADIRARQEADAKIDFLNIKVKDKDLGDISLERKAEWLAVSEEYDGLRAEHPKAEGQCAEAEARAKEIRTKIEQLEEFQRTVVAGAKQWWTKASDEIRTALTEKRWTDAIARAKTVAESAEFRQNAPHVASDAAAFLAGVPDAAANAANAEHTRILAEAEKQFTEEKVVEALKAVETWEKAARAHAAADPRFGQLADLAKQWHDGKSDAAQAKLREYVASDKTIFVDAYRKVRHYALPGNDADVGGPVFGFQFAEAAQALRASVEGRLRTWMYRERAEAVAARLDAAHAAWESWIRLLGEKKLWLPGEDIKGVPGVAQGAKLTLNPDRPATAAEFYAIVSVSGASTQRTLQWNDFTPAELFKLFVAPRLDRLPPETAGQLANVFALLAADEEALVLVDRAKAPVEQSAWAMSEIRAMDEYRRLARGDGMEPAQRIRAVDVWRKTHYRTDFFVLQDGRSAEETPQLFSEEEIDRFVDAFGEKK